MQGLSRLKATRPRLADRAAVGLRERLSLLGLSKLCKRVGRYLAKPHVPWFIKAISPRLYFLLTFGSTNPNTKRYWDSVWQKELDANRLRCDGYSRLHPAMLKYISEGDRILDVGCGTGAFLKRCSKIPGVELYGCDLSPVAVSGIRGLVVEARVTKLPALPTDWERRFDVVTCAEVLEHLSRPEASATSMVRCLKPGARLIISVPVEDAPGECDEHVQAFDAGRLQSMLEQCGLRQVDVHRIDENERTSYWLATGVGP